LTRYILRLIAHDVGLLRRVTVLTVTIVIIRLCNFAIKSHSIIHAYRFASVSKRFHIFSKSNLKSNRDLLNRIFIVQIESPKVLKSRFKSQQRLRFVHHWLSVTAAAAAAATVADKKTHR